MMEVCYSGTNLKCLILIFVMFIPAWFTAVPIWSDWIALRIMGIIERRIRDKYALPPVPEGIEKGKK